MIYKEKTISKKPDFLKILSTPKFMILIDNESISFEYESIEEYFIDKNKTLFVINTSLDTIISNDKHKLLINIFKNFFYNNKVEFKYFISPGYTPTPLYFGLKDVSDIIFNENAAKIFIEYDNSKITI